MHLDAELAEKHNQKGYKFYTFNNLYPTEEDKLYKAGRIYVFRIRSLERDFIVKMKQLLPEVKNSSFRVLASEVKIFNQRHISELYTITPAVATINNRNWVAGDDFLLLQERIQMNLEKKYKAFFQEKLQPTQSLIQHIEMVNQKPMKIKYKNTSLIGNKFKIHINEDQVSQSLAFVALATGILEKNSSCGCGFCSAR
jgi:CRISPR-associated endoribonuclease Cas6